MIQTLAIFDGEMLQPEVPLNLKAGTKVQIIVQPMLPDPEESLQHFWQMAQPPRLEDAQGSEKMDHYLYGEHNLDEDDILWDLTS